MFENWKINWFQIDDFMVLYIAMFYVLYYVLIYIHISVFKVTYF